MSANSRKNSAPGRVADQPGPFAQQALAPDPAGAIPAVVVKTAAAHPLVYRKRVARTETARPGDLVISCGKGHEQSMCFGETEYPWDDRVAMRAALSRMLGLPGPAMPWLPTSPSPPAGGAGD